MALSLSSPGSLHTFVSLAALWLTVGAAGQQQPAPKPSREIKMFAARQDGTLVPVDAELAASDSEQSVPRFEPMLPQGVNIKNGIIMMLARLPGGKAQFRYLYGQDVRMVAILPASIDPRQFELQLFLSRGGIRVGYLNSWGKNDNKNTHPFRARHAKDGRWLFEPEEKLDPGEYCFSPTFNNENFCFGVDKK